MNLGPRWSPDDSSVLAGIESTGANTVRIALSSGHRWPQDDAGDVRAVIESCGLHHLICVLTVHDTTGYGDVENAPDAVPLSKAVDYWVGIRQELTGREADIVINIGNEPFGDGNSSAWLAATKDAIGRLRAAGLRHLLMIDAPDWGQDREHLMLESAREILALDPEHNVVFDVHMYGHYDEPRDVSGYLAASAASGIPLVVGGFGNRGRFGSPDEAAIMAWTRAYDIGWLVSH